MKIELDLLSLIVGYVLCELFSAYIHCYIKPIIRRSVRQYKETKELKEKESNGPTIGFNSCLKK